MPHNNKTKIVATLGPATDTKEILTELARNGVNVFRINFSHADYDDVRRKVKIIREINVENNFNIAILGDLQGPKLRVGVMEEGVELEDGDTFTFTTEKCIGTKEKAFMTYQRFPKDVKVGEHILVDDGKLMFEVISTNKATEVVVKVIVGGALKSKKGVNLPNTAISLPALTEKDMADAVFAIEQEVDWMALSFVRTPEDLRMLRDLIAQHSDYRIPIIAKIAKSLGMIIHYHNRSKLSEEKEQGAIYHDDIKSLFGVSDVLSICCPATKETENLINKETLEYFPTGAVITNVARGDIVEDEALIDALNRRKIYAAGLDVYKGEPNLNPGYLKIKSVFILPHLGSATKHTRIAMANLAIDNIDEFFKTGNCKNKVN